MCQKISRIFPVKVFCNFFKQIFYTADNCEVLFGSKISRLKYKLTILLFFCLGYSWMFVFHRWSWTFFQVLQKLNRGSQDIWGYTISKYTIRNELWSSFVISIGLFFFTLWVWLLFTNWWWLLFLCESFPKRIALSCTE